MSRVKKPFNPFYVLLILAGTVFALSSCAYVVMMVRMARAETVEQHLASQAGLLGFLATSGERMLMIELAVLAATTFAAIGTDEFWSRRAARRESSEQQTS